MGYISKSKARKTSYDGSSCTGSDGATNRTLVHTKNLGSDSLVVVGRSTLMITDDYTVSGATITFLIAIDDVDNIMVVA